MKVKRKNATGKLKEMINKITPESIEKARKELNADLM